MRNAEWTPSPTLPLEGEEQGEGIPKSEFRIPNLEKGSA